MSFLFISDMGELTTAGAFVAEVPSGLRTKDELMEALYETLKLPDYFGMNWDALDECINDFSWIEENDIYIVHSDLPKLGSKDLGIYIDILKGSIENDDDRCDHRVIVAFPRSYKSAIRSLIVEP